MTERLRGLLDRYRDRFDALAHIPRDPLQFPHRYADPADQEVAGFLAASLAFGRVGAFAPVVGRILDTLGPSPAHTLLSLHAGVTEVREVADDAVRDAATDQYRWLQPLDIEAMLRAVGATLAEFGDLQSAFLYGDDEGPDTWNALEAFLSDLKARALDVHPEPEARKRAVSFLFPSTKTAACKRQHLWLRWMVRVDAKGADLGVWDGVDPSRLVMPCDVHTARIGHALGLCERPEASRRTADQLTTSLRRFAPDDPVRYDFALCHLGISGGCRARWVEEVCGGCDLRPACRWTAGEAATKRL